MTEVNETRLPGVGLRHDFSCSDGARVGVVSHRTGVRDLLVYDPDDPDAALVTVRLSPEEGTVLAELLGGTRLSGRLAGLQDQVEGLVIDWLRIPAGSPLAGRTLAETELRKRTGVVVVAVIRDGTPIPTPGADFALQGGDTAVVVGSPESVESLADLLES